MVARVLLVVARVFWVVARRCARWLLVVGLGGLLGVARRLLGCSGWLLGCC